MKPASRIASPLLGLAAACCLQACASTAPVTPAPLRSVAKPDDCAIDFYADRKRPPARAVEVVTKVKLQLQGSTAPGARSTLADDARAELRKQACRVGADAVLLDDYVESPGQGVTQLYVNASLLRYAAEPAAP